MKNVSQAESIKITQIQVPDKYRRSGDVVEDDKLRHSIERTGIQQPLVVSKLNDGKFVLIDGFRRLEVAKYLKHLQVPCVIDDLPKGVPPEEYRDRIRFILDEHRQDLFPSQRASLIKTLMANFKMNNKEVGEYLGVDATTIHNWLVVGKLIPEVQKAVDSGQITEHSARVFDGMTDTGQKRIWRDKKADFKKLSGGKLHQDIRKKYHPNENPDFYCKPERVAMKLKRKKQKRASVSRPKISASEMEMLSKDVELREAELKDAEKDLKEIKHEISLAVNVIRPIIQNEKLFQLVPADIKPQLKRFAEIYI
jgi:ParB/RepB/Spo0J family partition protein